MRRVRLYLRDYRSCVQLTSIANTKDIMRQVANGEPVQLNVNGVSGAYDFDGDDVDFDKPLVEDAPSKIDQQFYKDRYISTAFAATKDTPPVDTPPVTDPPQLEA